MVVAEFAAGWVGTWMGNGRFHSDEVGCLDPVSRVIPCESVMLTVVSVKVALHFCRQSGAIAVSELVRSWSLKMCASMVGPKGETWKVVLATDLIVARLGNSTVRPLCGCNFSCGGTSESLIKVSVAPVSANVGMAAGVLCGVVIKFAFFEESLIDGLMKAGFKTISPLHQVWPPGCDVGLVALR